MASSLNDLRETVDLVVTICEGSNNELPSLKTNARQCKLLSYKLSETLVLLLHEFEDTSRQETSECIYWTVALTELHRVVKVAKVLVLQCCDHWLIVEIIRGSLKEAFAKILYDLEWHTRVLCSRVFAGETRLNWNGKLSTKDDILLSASAKRDEESLRKLLTSSHVCDGEICKPDVGEKCLAVQLLAKVDAEKQVSEGTRTNTMDSLVPRFLWVKPQHLPKGEKLGVGSYAKVRETEWLGQKLAQKIFPDGSSSDLYFRQEVAAMVGLEHPNIVRVICCSENGRNFSIVMERLYKSLYDLLRQDCKRSDFCFSMLQAVDLMQQIAEGVRYLHSRNLVHRDLKSLNILVQCADPLWQGSSGTRAVNFTINTSFTAKIGDFGLAKMKDVSTRRSHQTENLGTRKWMAPETPNTWDLEAPSPRIHPMKLDVYSFGIMCYEILSGDEVYEGVPQGEIFGRVKAGLRPMLPRRTPQRLADLIQQCWNGDPLLRPDFPTICTELRVIKSLLLQGVKSGDGIGYDFKYLRLDSVQVQGPWGVLDEILYDVRTVFLAK